ncbi:MAG: hypothetical protein CMJ81_14530 [Planctomycetaceae bacterium]|nr:hypothetical protein [Planctomycetaceae bacterium]MBP60904.1 hypothetical protein [Planctomycetaceae bacterium]
MRYPIAPRALAKPLAQHKLSAPRFQRHVPGENESSREKMRNLSVGTAPGAATGLIDTTCLPPPKISRTGDRFIAGGHLKSDFPRGDSDQTERLG